MWKMTGCINKNAEQFQTLKKRSGISELALETKCRLFIDKYGRWPNLDELPNANSSNALKEALNLDEDGFIKTQNILDYFGKSNIKESIIEANKQFSDLEISILQIGDESIVKFIRRPNKYNFKEIENVLIKKDINFPIFINFQLLRLADLYGINIIPVTIAELNQNEKFQGFPIDAQSNKGFIYNENIYLNTDNMTVDTPVHELLHLFFGSIRFSNPELYVKLISTAENFKSYNYHSKYFQNRTRQDINEELFILEFSKYISGRVSEIDNISEADLYEINYNINRVLDSILMGQHTAGIVSNKYVMSLRLISEVVKSSELNGNSMSSLTEATIHRTLDNMKSDLMTKGELKEYC